MSKILIISSQIHKQLSADQLDYCVELVKKSGHNFEVESLQAGAYEIPFVINSYQQHKPFDGYIALGLLLKSNPDHYDNIMSHIRYCFTHFALNNIIVGNGIISGSTVEELTEKVHSPDPCHSAYPSACKAVSTLIQFRSTLS